MKHGLQLTGLVAGSNVVKGTRRKDNTPFYRQEIAVTTGEKIIKVSNFLDREEDALTVKFGDEVQVDIDYATSNEQRDITVGGKVTLLSQAAKKGVA